MVRFLLVLLVAGRVSALETPAVTREHAQQIAPVTPAECRLPWESGDPAQTRRHRVETGGGAPKSTAPVQTPATSAAAPPIALAFHSTHSLDILPADAAGAIGPNHVVGAFNSGLYIHNREGTLLASYPTFWSEGFEVFSFDPRILRDDAAGRWVTVAVNDDGFEKDSGIVLGVSNGADPTAGWRRYKIGSPIRGAADFIQLAQTKDSIVFSFNVWAGDFAEGLNLIVIDKAALYALPNAMPITRYDFSRELYALPVTVRDSADHSIRVIFQNDGFLNVTRLAGGTFSPIGQLPPPQGVLSGDFSYAPQLGTNAQVRLDPWDLSTAVIRNDVLWIVRTVRLRSATAIAFTRATANLGSVENVMLADPAGQTYLAFPSIAVNRDGAALVGFGQFSATQYPSAGYMYRDPSGNWSERATLKSGERPYRQELWGDYSTTLVDPVNDTDFWTVQSYAYGFDPIQATWGTWWSKITAAKPPTRGRSVRRF